MMGGWIDNRKSNLIITQENNLQLGCVGEPTLKAAAAAAAAAQYKHQAGVQQ